MRIHALLLTVCASAIVALALPCRTAAQEGGAGIVEEIHGTVYWRSKPGARARKLDSKADDARIVYPGEQVRCARGGSLRLRLGRSRRTVLPSSWVTIRPAATSRSDAARRMLDDYGGVGGLDRADQSKVFAPSEHSVAVPGEFSVRWVPDAPGCKLSLTIRDVSGERVWRREDVDGSAGSLIDEDARRELLSYRTRTGAGPLTLHADDSCEGESHVNFLLLSVTGEQSLKRDLARWAKADGLLLVHLGRASVYSRYGVFPRAAEEYEAALQSAPHSRQLLIRTIKAHRQTGNFLRAQALEKLLPSGTDIP